MYEQPKLNQVGKAGDVILGVASRGDDLDGLVIARSSEYAEDTVSTPILLLLEQILRIFRLG